MGHGPMGCEWDGGGGVGRVGRRGCGGRSMEAILIPGTYSTDPGNIL